MPSNEERIREHHDNVELESIEVRPSSTPSAAWSSKITLAGDPAVFWDCHLTITHPAHEAGFGIRLTSSDPAATHPPTLVTVPRGEKELTISHIEGVAPGAEQGQSKTVTITATGAESGNKKSAALVLVQQGAQ